MLRRPHYNQQQENRHKNLFFNNSLFQSQITFDLFSDNNEVKWNDFFQIKSTVIHTDTKIVVHENYWEGWSTPDNPYGYQGYLSDPSPSKIPNNPLRIHYITFPFITSPKPMEFLTGVVRIEWLASIGHEKESIVYNLSCTTNGTWIPLASNVTYTTYSLDSARFPYGANFPSFSTINDDRYDNYWDS